MAKQAKTENTKIMVTLPKTAIPELEKLASKKGLATSAFIRVLVMEHINDSTKQGG